MDTTQKADFDLTVFLTENAGWIALWVTLAALLIGVVLICYLLFFTGKAKPLRQKHVVEEHQDPPHKAGHDEKKAHGHGGGHDDDHGHGGIGKLLFVGTSFVGGLTVLGVIFWLSGGPRWFDGVLKGTIDGVGTSVLRATVGNETVDRRAATRGTNLEYDSARVRYTLPPAPDYDPQVPNRDPDSKCSSDSTELQTEVVGEKLVPIRPPEKNMIFCSEGETYANVESSRVQLYAFADGSFTACADSGTVWCEQRSEILGLRSGVEGEKVTVTFRWSKSRKDKKPDEMEKPPAPPSPQPPEEAPVGMLGDLS